MGYNLTKRNVLTKVKNQTSYKLYKYNSKIKKTFFFIYLEIKQKDRIIIYFIF